LRLMTGGDAPVSRSYERADRLDYVFEHRRSPEHAARSVGHPREVGVVRNKGIELRQVPIEVENLADSRSQVASASCSKLSSLDLDTGESRTAGEDSNRARLR